MINCISGPPLSTDLVSHCYNWPDEEFSPTNKATLKTGLPEGSTAIDFTLKDTRDVSWTLSDLLKTKPVLMVFGSYT
ncbi:MAG: hypothetical protein A2161_20685 [Candidatus Schekmanbacteria bacterium RBG_13_48_7]|uniref:Uncharacterized protein n=1 Tax=Candidatus Schekmanbacteria bacterium RBG_13_48_7 TaxID=1817878 RepID=A0A1F7RNT2_9BACT|nr:MAG: hypothetical protein A2161_20685 [Candidatus Schekmanbacteria bacterium RBG_13_48_7]